MKLMDYLNDTDRFANSRGVATVGVNNSATFLRSARLGDRLIAECSEVMGHHKLPICEVKVSNGRGFAQETVT